MKFNEKGEWTLKWQGRTRRVSNQYQKPDKKAIYLDFFASLQGGNTDGKDALSINCVGNMDYWFPGKVANVRGQFTSRHELMSGDYSERAAGALGSLITTAPSGLWARLPPLTSV